MTICPSKPSMVFFQLPKPVVIIAYSLSKRGTVVVISVIPKTSVGILLLLVGFSQDLYSPVFH